jgi:hypothetical protein
MSELGLAIPNVPKLRMPDITNLKLIHPEQREADLYMEGLKAQVKQLEANLAPNQQLYMTCWHGHEKFEVLNVRMPSHNVVALQCIDEDGEITQVTGHMGAITFSFRVVTSKELVEPRRIGFEMPNAREE